MYASLERLAALRRNRLYDGVVMVGFAEINKGRLPTMDTLYTTHATATGGRNGKASTQDGRLSVELTAPVQPNRPATGTDPEQLFACGYAACYGGAVEYAAKLLGYSLTAPVQVDSTVSLNAFEKSPNMRFIIAVELTVHLQGVTAEQGHEITEKAHTICPYSNATRGNVDVVTQVEATPAAA
jgi:lipoyl-dependent peroxiredoxin